MLINEEPDALEQVTYDVRPLNFRNPRRVMLAARLSSVTLLTVYHGGFVAAGNCRLTGEPVQRALAFDNGAFRVKEYRAEVGTWVPLDDGTTLDYRAAMAA